VEKTEGVKAPRTSVAEMSFIALTKKLEIKEITVSHSKLCKGGILGFFIFGYEHWDSHRGFNHGTLSIYESAPNT